jgi:hypothetical protein
MEIRILATLPRISIEEEELQMEGGRLIKVPFDEVLEFEKQEQSADYDKQRFGYENHPPVFFEKKIIISDDFHYTDANDFTLKLSQIAKPHINTCVLALYLYTGIPVLSPFLSTIYFDTRKEENFKANPELRKQFENYGANRIYGESEKEFTFCNEFPAIHLKKFEQNAFRKFYSFISSKSYVLEHDKLQNELNSLNALALPGINISIKLVLLIGALESFLIPEFKKDINEHFTKRFNNFGYENTNQDKLWMNQAYKIRCEIIHGRDGLDKLFKKIPYNPQVFFQLLLQCAITGLCMFLQYSESDTDIENQLEKFRGILSLEQNDNTLIELIQACNYKNKNDLTHQWKLQDN